MYAVIVTGGKQYKVTENEVLKIEKIDADSGENIQFDQVLMIAEGEKINLGKPYIKGSKVTAQVLSHGRAKKVHVLKFKRRKQYLKRQGHRQGYTEVKITGIAAG